MIQIPISVTHPELVEMWSERNLPLTPDQVSAGGHDKVWWKGSCGHEWQRMVNDMTKSRGCPYCNSHRLLKGFNDLATKRPDVAVSWSEKNLPLTPSDVMPYSNKIVWWRCINCGKEYEATPNTRSNSKGLCPECSLFNAKGRRGSFPRKHPELRKEFSEKNHPLTFDELTTNYQESIWWKCPDCGREYHRTLKDKMKKFRECPYCSGAKLERGFNDIPTTHPQIAAEWDPEKNDAWLPEDVTARSKKYVWWRCPVGHSWGARVRDRIWHGMECRVCAAEFTAALPMMAVMKALEENGHAFVVRSEAVGERFDIYCEELLYAADIGGVSEEMRSTLSKKKKRLKKKGIRYSAFHVMADHEAALDAAAESLVAVGVLLEGDRKEMEEYLQSWFDRVRPRITAGQTEKGGTKMDEDLKLLLRLILEREQETEAGQDVRHPKKKKVDPEKGIDYDPDAKPERKFQVSDEIVKRFRDRDFENSRADMYANHENNVSNRKEVPIWEKYALSVTEATQYFHIGRKKLREIINKDKYANYLVWNGGHVFIKRKLFEEYLDHEVEL